MAVTQQALWAGIDAMGTGSRVNDISQAIEDFVRRRGSYGIVRGYSGHGIGTALHMDPDVPNLATRRRTARLRPGMVLAIEPMIVMGSPQVREMSDQWTVTTLDRSVAAHFEHTVALTEDGPVVLTVD
jgi:methionyl aminopeptidase